MVIHRDKKQPASKEVTKAASVLSSEPAKIVVGPEEREFLIHKGLLCHYSEYFRGALSGSFKEGLEGAVPMPQEDPYLFEIVVSWCYTRKLQDMADKAGSEMDYLDLINLWIFGDKHIIPALQNAVMDAFMQKNAAVKHIPSCYILHIYENTMPRSQMRRVVIDLVAYTGGLDEYVECVLSFWSDYYRGMLNGPFREAKGKTLTSDEDPYIFAIFESFCYTNQLTDGAVTKGTDLLFTTLVRLWIFGDRVIAPALQNMAMTALMEKSVTGNVVPLERVLYVYENTMPRAPLRRWLIDRIAHTTCIQSWLSEHDTWWNEEILKDLLVVSSGLNDLDREQNKLPAYRLGCYYHVHNEETLELYQQTNKQASYMKMCYAQSYDVVSVAIATAADILI
ncbi:unnamed protein product [Aureobasidium pullulans]|nr:unnamed protein product [Aureobasidium pullulans]